jgi:imidazolonepropionase-like amidohydrolase
MRTVAMISFAALSAFEAAVAQTPNALTEAMPLLRGAPRVAFRNVRVVDGTGAPARPNQTLIIESGRILAVGSRDNITIPEGTRTLDLDGRTVLPGLVMLHEHTGRQPLIAARLFLAFGMTTGRTAGTNHAYADLNLKRRIDAGRVPGPELHLTGPFFTGEGSELLEDEKVREFLEDKIVRGPEDARRAVRYWAEEGFTSFKATQDISKHALATIIDEAHRLGLTVTAHLGGGTGVAPSMTCREAVELGIDNLEHAFGPCTRVTKDNLGTDPAGPGAQSLMRLLIQRNVVLTFTPYTANLSLSGDQLELLHPTGRERYEQEQRTLAKGPVPSEIAGVSQRLTLAFARAGGRVVLGSDPGAGGQGRIPGLSNHDTLKRVVRAGFSPLETIRMATLDGATFLGSDNRTGSIAAGKEADFLVVRGTPDRTIEDIDNIEIVFSNGTPYEPQALLASVKGQVRMR